MDWKEDRAELVATLVDHRRRFSLKNSGRIEEEARKDHAAIALGMTRREYDAYCAQNDRYVASVRALEDRLIAGIDWLGFTAWSESENARRERLEDPARYEKIESLWISVLRQYEWALQELKIRGIPYQSRPLDGVADPHPYFEILEQDFDLTSAEPGDILRIGIFAS